MTPLAVVLAAAGWLSLGGSEGIPVETWCRARCAEVFRGEVKRPRCKRYEPEWYVEEGKAKERRKFNQP